MARKKPLIQRMADILLEIDDVMDLTVNDTNLHKRIMSLLDEASEDEGRDELDDEWYTDNGY